MEPKLIWMLGLAAGATLVLAAAALARWWRHHHNADANLSNTPSTRAPSTIVWGVTGSLGLIALTYQFGLAALVLAWIPLLAAILLPCISTEHDAPTVAQTPGRTPGPKPGKVTTLFLLTAVTLIIALELRLAAFAVETLTDRSISQNIAVLGLTGLAVIITGIGARLLMMPMSLLLLAGLAVSLGGLGFGVTSMEVAPSALLDLARTMNTSAPEYADGQTYQHLFQLSSASENATTLGAPLAITLLIAALGLAALAPSVWQAPATTTRPATIATRPPVIPPVMVSLIGAAAAALLALTAYALGADMTLSDLYTDKVKPTMSYLLAEQGAGSLLETDGGAASVAPFLFNLFSDAQPWLPALWLVTTVLLAQTLILATLAPLRCAVGTHNGSHLARIAVAVASIAIAGWLALSHIRIEQHIIWPLEAIALGLLVQLLPAQLLARAPLQASAIAATIGLLAGTAVLLALVIAFRPPADTMQIWPGWPLGLFPAIPALAANLTVTALAWAFVGKTYQDRWSDFFLAFWPVIAMALLITALIVAALAVQNTTLFHMPGLLLTFLVGWLTLSIIAVTVARNR